MLHYTIKIFLAAFWLKVQKLFYECRNLLKPKLYIDLKPKSFVYFVNIKSV